MGDNGLKVLHGDLFSKFLDEWIVWGTSGENLGDVSLGMCYWMFLMKICLCDHRHLVGWMGHICDVFRVSGVVSFEVCSGFV